MEVPMVGSRRNSNNNNKDPVFASLFSSPEDVFWFNYARAQNYYVPEINLAANRKEFHLQRLDEKEEECCLYE